MGDNDLPVLSPPAILIQRIPSARWIDLFSRKSVLLPSERITYEGDKWGKAAIALAHVRWKVTGLHVSTNQ